MSLSDLIVPVGDVVTVPIDTARPPGMIQIPLANLEMEQLFNAQFLHTNIQKASFSIQSKSGYQIQFPGKVRHGYDWIKIKSIICELIEDPKAFARYPDIRSLQWNFDEDVKRAMRNIILNEEAIPVRSGLLKDTIMMTVHVVRYAWWNTHIVHSVSYQTPPFYPYPIGGNVQHTNEEGIALTYRPLYTIINAHLIEEYPTGFSLYLMNDPQAQPDWMELLNPKLQEYYIAAFSYFFTNLDIAIYCWQEEM